jgi:hypothetical protein
VVNHKKVDKKVDKNVDNFFVKYKFEFVTDLWELILEQ